MSDEASAVPTGAVLVSGSSFYAVNLRFKGLLTIYHFHELLGKSNWLALSLESN